MQWDLKIIGCCPVRLLAFLLLASCTVGPDYVRPPTETAAQWLEAEDQRLKTTSTSDQAWWKTFNDPILNKLINRAYHDNLSIRVAGVRVLEARAQLGIAIGNFYPQNQQFTSSLSKVHLSQRASQAAFSHIFDYAQTQLGLTASWEIDFWGKFRRALESADAGFRGCGGQLQQRAGQSHRRCGACLYHYPDAGKAPEHSAAECRYTKGKPATCGNPLSTAVPLPCVTSNKPERFWQIRRLPFPQ